MSQLVDQLRKHVDVLAELIGERNSAHPSAIEAAREYIRRELREMGHTVVEHPFMTTMRAAANLEVHLVGTKPERPMLVIGAHYDSAIGTPGADDNASAVAILLEIGRALVGVRLKRSLRIVFYDCEEPPHFSMGEMGSQHHARMLRKADEKLMGMICLESLGYFPRTVVEMDEVPWPLRWMNKLLGGRYVVIVSNVPSAWFGLRFVARFATSGRFRFLPAALPVRWVPEIALSDHRGYWEQSYPALMVTDTAFLRNPNYHMPSDRLATLDLPRMAKLCRMLQRVVRRLCR
jgi:hypothetical protein